MFIQNFLSLVISEEEDKLFLHELSLILEIVTDVIIPLIFNLILNDLFNNVLKSHDANHFLGWVSVLILYYLSDDTNVSQSFLEKTKKRL